MAPNYYNRGLKLFLVAVYILLFYYAESICEKNDKEISRLKTDVFMKVDECPCLFINIKKLSEYNYTFTGIDNNDSKCNYGCRLRMESYDTTVPFFFLVFVYFMLREI